MYQGSVIESYGSRGSVKGLCDVSPAIDPGLMSAVVTMLSMSINPEVVCQSDILCVLKIRTRFALIMKRA